MAEENPEGFCVRNVETRPRAHSRRPLRIAHRAKRKSRHIKQTENSPPPLVPIYQLGTSIPVAEMNVEEVPTGLFIGGSFRPAASGATFSVLDPATDRIVATVAQGSASDAREAVGAASEALLLWRSLTGPERAGHLRSLFDLVCNRREWIASIITAEEGKPLAEARGEVDYGAGFLEWAAEEARRVGGETISASDAGKRIAVLHQGIGVTGAVTPWNFPLAMITRKLGPALAAGCTQVIKPASQTPLTALALCSLVVEAGFPPGTVNLVMGPAAEIVETWFADPAVRKVSFTGSTEVGQQLIRLSARNITRLSLELGGHAPVIVFEDADLDLAVSEAVRGKFRNSGQSCISPNRYYVADQIYPEFVERFAAEASELVIGPGSAPDVEIGPLIDDRAVEKVQAHVADAVARGARLVCGGALADVGQGYTARFYQPTVLADVDHSMMVSRQETFGPVAPVARFRHEKEVIDWANDTPYGLAGYLFTRDLARATRVSEALDCGIIGINDCLPSAAQAPFGGMKHSGYGREGGAYAMHEYLITKYLSTRI